MPKFECLKFGFFGFVPTLAKREFRHLLVKLKKMSIVFKKDFTHCTVSVVWAHLELSPAESSSAKSQSHDNRQIGPLY